MIRSQLTKIIIVSAFILCWTPVWPDKGDAADKLDIDVSGSVRTGYDDNPTYAPEDKKDDFVTRLQVGLGLRNQGKTYDLSIDANLRQDLFLKHTEFNYLAPDINLDFVKELSKYDRLTLTNFFIHSEEPRSFDDAFGQGAGRYSYNRNQFRLGYEKDFSKQLTGKVHYGNELYRVSREDLSDWDRHTFNAEGAYAFSSDLIVSGIYKFDYRNLDPGNDAIINRLVARVRKYLTPQLYVEGDAGVSFVNNFDAADSTTPIFGISATNEWDEVTKFRVGYLYQSSNTGSTEAILDSGRFFADVTRQLLERLAINIGAFYGNGEYDSLNIEEQLFGANIRLNYAVSENTEAFFTYFHVNKESDSASENYAKNYIGIGLAFKF